MKAIDFPIKDVKISFTDHHQHVNSPLFTNDFMKVSSNEILIDIENVASYFITEGNAILIYPHKGARDFEIQDQLEKWGVISILHQRRILNFHASSFSLDGSGIMICGDSGTGKSSITAAFTKDAGEYLNDDITAIRFINEKPQILQYGRSISLFGSTIQELDTGKSNIQNDNTEELKDDYNVETRANIHTPLSLIFTLDIHDNKSVEIKEIKGHEKFSLLRGNICSWEILNGIPGSEISYMEQLLKICDSTSVYIIRRPYRYPIEKLKKVIVEALKTF